MEDIKKIMFRDRKCIDCGINITRQSKTGRCRNCSAKLNLSKISQESINKRNNSIRDGFKNGRENYWKGKKGILKHTEEWKREHSKKMTGRVKSEETRKKISISHKGKSKNEEWRKNISNSKKGVPVHTEEWKRKHSERMTGENGPNWKGGLTKKGNLLRSNRDYKKWRINILFRDEWKCMNCGNTNKETLEVHHIVPMRDLLENREKLLDISNGVTLCKECHSLIDKQRGRFNGFK